MSDETIRENQEALAQLAKESPESMGLVAQIMYASAQENQATLQQLYELSEKRRVDAETRLALVRDRIMDLYSGPWIPSPDAVLGALHPSLADVERHIAEQEQA